MKKHVLLLFAAVILSVGGASAAFADEPLPERFRPSGKNSTFAYEGLTYENYLKLVRKMIANARVDLEGADRDSIVDANAPFQLVPGENCGKGQKKHYRRGVLMTHGLTDSPYFMRGLGAFFQKNCFLVHTVLLPGHGTRPGDLLEVEWQEWLNAETYGANTLSAEADDIYLLGFSTGGALSVYESLFDKRVKGVFLFSPAIEISPLAMLANWHEIYSWQFPKAKWLDILPDEDPFKYESFPKNAADQIHLLTKTLRATLESNKVVVPVFVAASQDDATVITASTLNFFKNDVTNPAKRMVLYSASGVAPTSDNIEVVNSLLSGRRILSSAHTAIVLPPTDPQYGENGRYANCAHYFGNVEKYRACKATGWEYLGETNDANLKKGVVRRLMFNPNYDAMLRSLQRFIDALPQ